MSENFSSLKDSFNSVAYISPVNFIINVILVISLSYVLGLIYIKFGKSISNRASLASSFPLLALSTMAIITVVKSSLALSLGLVGALSIVRFRTPIKEPEELIYLFLCLSLGLAVGADQRLIAFLTLLSVASLSFLMRGTSIFKAMRKNIFTVLITSKSPKSQDEFIKILQKYCKFIELKRFSNSEKTQICFSVIFNSYSDIDKLNNELNEASGVISLDIIDQSNIVGAS